MAVTRKGAVVAVGLVLATAQPGHAQQRSAVGDFLGGLFGTAPSRSPPQAVLMPDFRQTLMSNFGQRNVSAQDMQTAIGMLAQSLATGQPLYNANPQGVRISTTVGAPTGNGCRNAAIELRRAGNTGQADVRANTVACWTGQAWMTQGGGMTGQLPSPSMAQAPVPAFRPVQQQAQQPQPGRGGVTVSDQVDELRTMRVRTPLREMPDQASHSLGNLIENSKVSMTGHVAGMPGWVRINTSGKVGYTLEANLNPLDQQQAAQQPPAAPARPFTSTPPAAEVMPPPPWPVLEQVPPVAVPAPVQTVPEPLQRVIAPAAPPAPVQAPAPAPVAVEAPRAPVVAQTPQEAPRTAQAVPAAPTAAASPAAPPAPPAPPPRRRVDSAL